ncbi:MAG: 3-oxoacyl-ACP synthase III family protein [Eubacteriales bacterium]
MSFQILGTGSALPEKIVTNDELSTFIDTNDEWIRTRTGIQTRHILSDSESLLSLATTACRNAMDNAGIAPDEVDLLICTTLIGDYISPSMSCLIAKACGLTERVITLDMNMGCCGFVYALNMANAYFTSGAVKKAMVVSAESLTRLVNWEDRSTCCLFGDAAGAVVLGAREGSKVDFDLKVDGNAEILNITRGTDNCRYNTYEGKVALGMNGQEVYKFAVSSIAERIEAICTKNSLTYDDIAKFFLHQANMRIINSAIRHTKAPDEKFPHNIESTGNTSSATIPVLLDQVNRRGELTRGDKIILCAFGAGLASAACLIEW